MMLLILITPTTATPKKDDDDNDCYQEKAKACRILLIPGTNYGGFQINEGQRGYRPKWNRSGALQITNGPKTLLVPAQST
jgi:hypothetical protein